MEVGRRQIRLCRRQFLLERHLGYESVFAKPGYLTHEGRKGILKLAAVMQHREWLTGVWERSETFAPFTSNRCLCRRI